MTQKISGVHHLAVMAGDIKKHIEFFSEVLGCPLVALFDMHGVPGASHAFMKLNDRCYFSLVHIPGTEKIAIEVGHTHSGSGALPSAPGTMQHLAFGVDSDEDLIAIRDRIRAHGVNVIGPLDHGMCRSIYFAGPEQLTLEVATSQAPLDPKRWIDPAVLERAGISAEEAAHFKAPAPYVGPSPVPQPPIDPTKPHMVYPKEAYEKMMALPDDVMTKVASVSEPPVPETV